MKRSTMVEVLCLALLAGGLPPGVRAANDMVRGMPAAYASVVVDDQTPTCRLDQERLQDAFRSAMAAGKQFRLNRMMGPNSPDIRVGATAFPFPGYNGAQQCKFRIGVQVLQSIASKTPWQASGVATLILYDGGKGGFANPESLNDEATRAARAAAEQLLRVIEGTP